MWRAPWSPGGGREGGREVDFGRARGLEGPGIRKVKVGKRGSGGSRLGVHCETRCGGWLGPAAPG